MSRIRVPAASILLAALLASSALAYVSSSSDVSGTVTGRASQTRPRDDGNKDLFDRDRFGHGHGHGNETSGTTGVSDRDFGKNHDKYRITPAIPIPFGPPKSTSRISSLTVPAVEPADPGPVALMPKGKHMYVYYPASDVYYSMPTGTYYYKQGDTWTKADKPPEGPLGSGHSVQVDGLVN
jgi:hypothetical protein